MPSRVAKRRRHLFGGWSLATQLFAVQTGIILTVLLGAGLAAYFNARAANSQAARDQVLSLAHAVAATPSLRTALGSGNPSAALQPLTEQIRRDSGVDFVVVMTPGGTRFTHPTPAQIGGQFRGTITPAARGESLTETFAGTLGPSVRAVVPVRSDGQVIGLVSVGQTITRVDRELTQQLPILLATTLLSLLLAAAGSWMVRRWLRRTTHDLGSAELRRMYEYYDAVLHAVREGTVLLDRTGHLRLVNDEARRLLDLPPDAVGRRVDDVGLPQSLSAALLGQDELTDELFLTEDSVLVVSQAVARWAGRDVGAVVTLRDHTELRALVSELNAIRGFADALNAQAHESANHLHTVISLIELGRPEQALRFANTELALAQELTDLVMGRIKEPELAALVLGKVAEAHEQGVDLIITDDCFLPAGLVDPRDLLTIVGNLLDNAIDAAADAGAERWVRFTARAVSDPGREEGLCLQVADSGPGLAADEVARAFQKGWSTKPTDRALGRGLGLALVAQAVHRYGGSINVTRDNGAVFTIFLGRRPSSMVGDPKFPVRPGVAEAIAPVKITADIS
jgi:two-component system CitB family sensor kinase